MIYSTLRNGIQQMVYKIIDHAVRGLVRVGVTPNVVTTLGLIGNIFGAALIVWSAMQGELTDRTWIGIAGMVIILSSVLDMVDGYMARTAGMCTTFGAFYDSVLDRYCELLTLSALAFYLMTSGWLVGAVITFLSIIGSIMVSYVRARAEGLGLECKVGLMQRPERVVLTVVGMLLCFLQPWVEFDALWFVVVTQTVIAVMSNITAFHRILHVKKQL